MQTSSCIAAELATAPGGDCRADGVLWLQLSCFLVTAWEGFAKFEHKTIWEVPVEFTNVSVYQPVQVERTAKVELGVIFDFSNRFQVLASAADALVHACVLAELVRLHFTTLAVLSGPSGGMLGWDWAALTAASDARSRPPALTR